MPELPEVETARRLAEAFLAGRRLERVMARADPLVFCGRSPAYVRARLHGRRVQAVGRKGKHFWLELDRRPWPVFHFGMAGRLEPLSGDAAAPRHAKLTLVAEGGSAIVFSDSRRFGRIRLLRDPPHEEPIRDLGFDVLDELPGTRELAGVLAARTAPIKAVLLDQGLFAGVGNWIADEALFQARIRPDRAAADLRRAEVARLRARLGAVVRFAVAVGADSGRFPRGWLFHRRWGRDPRATTASGQRIVHITIAGRTAAFVPARQR